MGLITIGGQQVYVVDSKPVATARASNGVGYAQLVSQQRWKLYEEAEKNVLREMEFEKMSYEAQLDAYAKQKAALQKSILKSQELKEKVKNGEVSVGQAIQLAKMQRQIEDAEIRDAMVSRTTTETFNKYGEPITITSTRDKYSSKDGLGRSSVSGALNKALDYLGVETPKDKKEASVDALEAEWTKQEAEARAAAKKQGIKFDLEAWKKGAGKEIEDKVIAERAKPLDSYAGTDEEKQEFDAQISALERQLSSLSVPAPSFDTNVGARAREAYAGMVGMGGLGLAPRRSKISPVYDESRAREAMARQAAGFEEAIGTTAAANEADLRTSLLKGADVRNKARIAELQAASDLAGPEDAEFKKLIDQEIQKLSSTAPALTPEEEANIARTARQAAEQSFRATALETGPGLRTLGSFMDREPAETARRPNDDPRKEPRKPRGPRKDIDFDFLAGLGALAGEGIPSVYFGSGDVAEAGLSGMAPEGALTTAGRPPEDPALMGPDYSGFGPGVEFGVTTMPESGPARREPSETDSNFRKAMQRLSAESGRQPGDSAPSPVVIPGEAGIGGPPYMPEPPIRKPPEAKVETPEANKGSGESKEDKRSRAVNELYIQYAPRKINLDTGVETLVELNPSEKEKIFQLYLEEVEGKMMTDEEGKEWYSKAIEKIKSESPPTGKTKKKTRLESYSANLMNIMQKGQKLADQPTKLQRLAKLDLPEKDRAKVVPEHILLVDKLYNINSAKGDAFQTTFAEIERVYKNDDKKKKAAQEYLAAKEILTA